MSTIRMLHQLAHGVRYRPLSIVGGHVLVDSIADLRPAVRGVVGKWVPRDVEWLQPCDGDATLTLCKYGIVDAVLAAPPALLDHQDTQVGLDVLRVNGLLPKRGEPRDPDEPAILEDIVADFDPTTCFLMLMLRDDIDDRIHELWIHQEWMRHKDRTVAGGDSQFELALPKGYFPRDLTVIDACITNASFIWAAKHFYL